MKNKTLLILSVFSLSVLAACSSASSETANSNSNTNIAMMATPNPAENPTLNANIPPAATNSAIPGIPNAPGDAKISKEDPTRNAKPTIQGTAAPDNSVVTISLGENAVETRTFKNHPQLAKVERIQEIKNNRTVVKVYLRNGQARELPDGKIQNPMAAPASEILQAIQGAPAANPEPKAENPAPKTDETQPKPAGPPSKKQQ